MVSSMEANLIRQPIIWIFTMIGSVVIARALGPEFLAVVAAIRATVKTVVAFLDLGITKSIARIMPDISVQLGKTEAIRVLQQLLYLKLFMVSLGFIGLIVLDAAGFWRTREHIAYSTWFFPIVGASIFLDTLVYIKQQEWVASLRMASLAKLQIAVAVFTPVFVISVALISRDPYLVASAQLVPLVFLLAVFFTLTGYDLDSKGMTSVRFTIGRIFSQFWRYIGTTYLIFVFNSFVFGLPLTVFLLSHLGVELNAIGNIAVAISIVTLARQVANVPLVNLRVPILARVIAENDQVLFLKIQRVMASILVLTSSFMAIGMFTLGPPVLKLMYGEKYEAAISWGIPIAIIALFFNFFSMGNSTIRQVERYKPVIVGLCLSLIFIVVSNVIGVHRLPETLWPPLVVLTYVIGRAFFLITTDVWTDVVVFRWQGTGIKVRGFLALGLALLVAYWLLVPVTEQSFLGAMKAFVLSAIVFIMSFRFVGGVGTEVRKSLSNVIFPGFRWVVHII